MVETNLLVCFARDQSQIAYNPSNNSQRDIAKIHAKTIAVPWAVPGNSHGRSLTENGYIMFQNFWETQLCRFEKVFEHFIIRHSDSASIEEISRRNLGSWLVSSSSFKYRNFY